MRTDSQVSRVERQSIVNQGVGQPIEGDEEKIARRLGQASSNKGNGKIAENNRKSIVKTFS